MYVQCFLYTLFSRPTNAQHIYIYVYIQGGPKVGIQTINTILYTVYLYGPGFDSASNRNEHQEHFLGVKTAGA